MNLAYCVNFNSTFSYTFKVSNEHVLEGGVEVLNEHVLGGIVEFVQEGGRCVKRACTGGGGGNY